MKFLMTEKENENLKFHRRQEDERIRQQDERRRQEMMMRQQEMARRAGHPGPGPLDQGLRSRDEMMVNRVLF